MLTNSTENELLNCTEFMHLIPHLPIEDLLLTEYKIDSQWRKLIRLKDANKKLYHCSLCNVVQSGTKNLLAHIDGKKHKTKIRSTVQLYQPKYTYSKDRIQSRDSLNGVYHSQNGLKPSNTIEYISNRNGKQKKAMSSADMSLTGTTTDSIGEKTLLERNNDMPSVILIGNDRVQKGRFSNDEVLKMVDNYEPTPKKHKLVLNPAAVTTKIDDTATINLNADYITPKYQSNITILPTKIKHQERALHSRNSSNEFFSTKTFSCNPLDDTVIGLVGVEYVVKILKSSNDSHPKYECGLCEFTSDGFSMQNHLISYSHRLKFCEKHFPTAIRQYQQYIHNIPANESYKVMTPILNKLAIAIEQHHGRELPFECLENEFNINRHEILSKVFSCRHASEQYGPTFTHIIDSKEVDKLASELDKYRPQTNFSENIAFDLRPNSCHNIPAKYYKKDYIPHTFSRQQENSQRRQNRNMLSNKEIIDDETHKQMVEDFLKNTCRKRSFQFSNNLCQDQPNSESAPFDRHEAPSTLHEHNVWQTYRHLVDQKVMDLNELYQIYRTDPESHPRYDHEWQMFWKRRKSELIEVGLDHRTFNYQPEWVEFFNIRIEELYHQAVENIKIESRKRLCLSMTNEYLDDEKYFVHSKDNFQEKIVTNILAEKHTKAETSEIVEYSENTKIVSVLRFLTALEEYLGSLGPKVVILLSKALQIEKNFPASLSSIILNEENYSLLETVKEKFRGLIIAGILDDTKQRVLRKAIDGVEYLLSNANVENGKYTASFRATPLQMKENAANKKELVTNIFTQVDKKELAFKLADLLSAQGKTDVDPVQLQKIISVYMLIEEKKQRASKHESNQYNRFETSNSEVQQARNHANLLEKPSYADESVNSQSETHQVNEYFRNTSFCGNITSYGNVDNKFSNNYQKSKDIGSSYQPSQHISQNDSLKKTTRWTTTNIFHSPQYKTQGHVKRKNNSCGINLNWNKF